MTDRIDHAAAARKLLARYENASLHIIEATAAQAHATLALVEQQRIANLIALGYKYYGSREDTEGAYANLLKLEIRTALGLEEATGD